MIQPSKSADELVQENDLLVTQLEEAQEILTAIRTGGVDALVVDGPNGEQVFTLESADYPYRTFVESMNEGAVTLAMDGTIVYCNRQFADSRARYWNRRRAGRFSTSWLLRIGRSSRRC